MNTLPHIEKITSAAMLLGLLGLTACGGGASSTIDTGSDSVPAQLETGAAQVAVPTGQLPVSPPPAQQNQEEVITAIDVGVSTTNLEENPPEEINSEEVNSEEAGTEEVVSEEIVSTDPDAVVINQLLIDGASNVSCEAPEEIFRDTMLELVNATRIEARMCGTLERAAVSTIQWNNSLAAAAQFHANDMTVNNFFSHTGSDGLGVVDRVEATGYVWRAVGENIAAGQLDVAEVHQGWVDSQGHCVNIMNSAFTEVGAACVSDPGTDFGNYWVVVFGDSQ